ncbi:hypothetical protein CRG98_015260, partial [Punica granatum]
RRGDDAGRVDPRPPEQQAERVRDVEHLERDAERARANVYEEVDLPVHLPARAIEGSDCRLAWADSVKIHVHLFEDGHRADIEGGPVVNHDPADDVIVALATRTAVLLGRTRLRSTFIYLRVVTGQTLRADPLSIMTRPMIDHVDGRSRVRPMVREGVGLHVWRSDGVESESVAIDPPLNFVPQPPTIVESVPRCALM